MFCNIELFGATGAGSSRLWFGGVDHNFGGALSQLLDLGGERLHLPPIRLEARVFALSGGNQQRLVLTREVAHDPRLIVALYPSRGLDARSTDALRALFLEARAVGAGVLLFSEELDELVALSDRIVVLREGRIAAEFSRGSFAIDAIGAAMVGTADAA